MSAPTSWAQPADGGAVVIAPTFPLTELGPDPRLDFRGLEDSRRVTIPVPAGLAPVALNAIVELPIDPRPGVIAVRQDDRTISRVGLPPVDQAPIVIPLAGATVIDNAVTVTLSTYLLATDGYCNDPRNPLRLLNASITYEGAEQPPVTVAQFLPAVLRRLTIFLPEKPSKAEADATVQLATAAAARYDGQPTEIAIVALPEGQTVPRAPSQPLERQIVIAEGGTGGLSLSGAGVPWLLISGPPDDLKNQTRLLFSEISQLALAPKAVVGPLTSQSLQLGDIVTLGDLEQPELSATGLSPSVSVGLDQTKWARSIRSVRLHLLGSHTPVPGSDITVTVGNETIDFWRTEDNGIIDHWVDVPDNLLQRYTRFDIRLSGTYGPCGDFSTAGPGDKVLSLVIDDDSTVESRPATPPVPGGLRSLPQALMSPTVQIGIGNDILGDTVRAVTIMVGLQRMSVPPIDTTVMGGQEVIDSSNPGLVIAADGWNYPDVVLPVSAAPEGPVVVSAVDDDGKPATLSLTPPLRFASLQTVFDRGRSLLVATSDVGPAQLDELLNWLNSDRTRWSTIDGVALVSTPGQGPVTVNVVGSPDATSEGAADTEWLASRWLLWAGGGALALLAISLVLIVVLRRRRPL
nr:hypothetical protein [Mycobacterium sp. GA-1285]